MSGAALEDQAMRDSQAPQGLVVYLVSGANPGYQENQAFEALQVGPMEKEPQLPDLS